MAHKSQLDFVRLLAKQLPNHFTGARVLEIGSLDINGSVRQFFSNCQYTGLDIAPGPGVDVVCEGQKFNAPSESFDVVISCEAMEHNPHWISTIDNMLRLCKPQGLVIFTCATTGRPEHGTTRTDPISSPLTVGAGWDYYKNLTQEDIIKNTGVTKSCTLHRFWVHWGHYDLLFFGAKNGTHNNQANEVSEAISIISDWIEQSNSTKAFRYRRLAAKLIGEPWFLFMQNVMKSLEWINKPR